MQLEPCEKKVPKIIKGEDKNLDFKFINNKTKDPVDLTSATEIEAIFLNADGTFLYKRLTTGGIILVSGLGGHIQVQITDAESALLASSLEGQYSDIETNFVIAGFKTIVIFSQSVEILDRRYPTA